MTCYLDGVALELLSSSQADDFVWAPHVAGGEGGGEEEKGEEKGGEEEGVGPDKWAAAVASAGLEVMGGNQLGIGVQSLVLYSAALPAETASALTGVYGTWRAGESAAETIEAAALAVWEEENPVPVKPEPTAEELAALEAARLEAEAAAKKKKGKKGKVRWERCGRMPLGACALGAVCVCCVLCAVCVRCVLCACACGCGCAHVNGWRCSYHATPWKHSHSHAHSRTRTRICSTHALAHASSRDLDRVT